MVKSQWSRVNGQESMVNGQERSFITLERANLKTYFQSAHHPDFVCVAAILIVRASFLSSKIATYGVLTSSFILHPLVMLSALLVNVDYLILSVQQLGSSDRLIL